MSQANVNVGTSPGAGNGDSLYNAFSKINNNFTELYSTITSSGITYANIAPSVDSSASGSGLTLNITKYANIYGVSVNLAGTGYALGESVRVWGNVVGGSYTTHDLIVEVGTLANSSIGSVGTITFTGTPSVPLRTVAGRTGDVVLTTNDIIGLRSTFSSNADIQSVVDAKISANISSLIGTAPGVLDTLGEIADALNDDANVYNTLATSITTGNTNLKGYTDNLVTTANVNMKGYVDAEITAIGAHYGNADVLAYLNDNSYATETYVTTANTNVVGYVDGQVTTLNSAITTANLNLKGYVDGEIATVTAGHYSNTEVLAYLTDNSYATETYVTTANTNLKGYTDNKFGTFTLNSGTNTVTTSNGDGNLKLAINGATSDDPPALISRQWSFNTDASISFNDPFTGNPLANGVVSTTKIGQWNEAYGWGDHSTEGYGLSSDITTANVNLKGYVDGQVSTLNSAITTANTNVVGYVDNAVSTANVNLKGYVDSEISDTVSATGSSIAEANTNMRGYVDGQVTTLNSSITTANTNVVGYVDSAVSTANVNLKGYVDNELTSYATTSALTTANTNVVGYVDSAVSTANVNVVGYIDNEISTLIGGAPGTLDTLNEIAAALGDDPNLATTLTNTITSANLNMKGYVDGQVTTLNSTITTANTNVVGYVDNAVSTANVNLKGYVDNELTSYATTSALTTANTNVVGYVDGEITTVNSAITTANTNVVGYVDDAVSTANVNLKGYVDNEISGLSLGNISTINLDGNVSNVLAGDGTFITAGSGGTSYTDSDVDAHLNQSNPTSGYVLSWNGSDYAWVDNAGYADSDVNTLLASWGSNTLSTTGNVTVGDAIVNSGVKEAYGALSSATGTVTHDCSNGHVFYHTSISSDFTANFTNLQLDTGYVTTLTLVLSQGATAYIASAVQIEGVAQTIKWQGNVTPTGTDNGVDAMSFSVINSSGTYTVLGQLVDFGG